MQNALELFPKSVVVCCMGVSLVCGSPNVVSVVLGYMAHEYPTLKDNALIQSFAVLGLFVSMPAGLVIDKYGELICMLLCAPFVVLCYYLISISTLDLYVAIVVAYSVVGFGCGGVFVAALKLSIKAVPKYSGIAVALVGACLSLSLMFSQAVLQIYEDNTDCDVGPSPCWRSQTQVLSVISGVFYLAFGLPLVLLRWFGNKRSAQVTYNVEDDKEEFLHGVSTENEGIQVFDANAAQSMPLLDQADEPPQQPAPLSFSVRILVNVFFWILIFGYCACIGSGLGVTLNIGSVWAYFAGESYSHWVQYLYYFFSIVNTIGNLLSGLLGDYLIKRKVVTRKTLCASVLFYLAAVNFGLAFLLLFGDKTSPACVVGLAILLVAVSFGFGSALTLYPALVADLYGFLDFGVYFSYAQIGPMTATFAIPPLFNTMVTTHYPGIDFGNAGPPYLFLASLSLLVGLLTVLKKPTPVDVVF